MIVQVCIGSSCHLKGSYDIVELLQKAVQRSGYDCEITLAGSFCTGLCNRVGVTIAVDEEVVTQVTRENFREFWEKYIVPGVHKERQETHD